MKNFITIFGLFIFSFNYVKAEKNLAKEIQWSISEESTIDISAKYTFGTHKLSTSNIKGKILYKNNIYAGELVVPIASIKEGNAELECHLHEALGLNYENSDYPKKHVCDENNKLPENGSNAVVYPEIKFKVEAVDRLNDKFLVNGEWSMHGVSKKEKIEFKILEENLNILKIQGQTQFNLKDYGIKVKNAFIVSVNNLVDVKLNLILNKKELK